MKLREPHWYGLVAAAALAVSLLLGACGGSSHTDVGNPNAKPASTTTTTLTTNGAGGVSY